MSSRSVREECEKEIELAIQSRDSGNEGRARVCARRAAGLAGRNFLKRHGFPAHGSSAFEVLKTLAAHPDLAPGIRQAAVHLTLPVNDSFNLPVEVDLVVEARQILDALLEES